MRKTKLGGYPRGNTRNGAPLGNTRMAQSQITRALEELQTLRKEHAQQKRYIVELEVKCANLSAKLQRKAVDPPMPLYAEGTAAFDEAVEQIDTADWVEDVAPPSTSKDTIEVVDILDYSRDAVIEVIDHFLLNFSAVENKHYAVYSRKLQSDMFDASAENVLQELASQHKVEYAAVDRRVKDAPKSVRMMASRYIINFLDVLPKLLSGEPVDLAPESRAGTKLEWKRQKTSGMCPIIFMPSVYVAVLQQWISNKVLTGEVIANFGKVRAELDKVQAMIDDCPAHVVERVYALSRISGANLMYKNQAYSAEEAKALWMAATIA